jgi:hypothetical protein
MDDCQTMPPCLLLVKMRRTRIEHMLSALPPIAILEGLNGARKRHMHRSKQHRYSITSSARASSDGGTSRPSALAVLRLITSSNLVGCSTGRSAGFVPFKILST